MRPPAAGAPEARLESVWLARGRGRCCARCLAALGLRTLVQPGVLADSTGHAVANLTGGFLIGVVAELIGRHAGLPPELRLFLITGFLGGLTTFSAEAVALLERAQYGWAGALIVLHVVGSVSATIAGIACVRAIH